jgi:hypothetical protein
VRRLRVDLALMMEQSLLNVCRLADEKLIIKVEQPIDAGNRRRAGEYRRFRESIAPAVRVP